MLKSDTSQNYQKQYRETFQYEQCLYESGINP